MEWETEGPAWLTHAVETPGVLELVAPPEAGQGVGLLVIAGGLFEFVGD
jgi:hypothetical protein